MININPSDIPSVDFEIPAFDWGNNDAVNAGKTLQRKGFALGSSLFNGVALIARYPGYPLILRLKDTRPLLREEISWWAGSMAGLIPSAGYDYVGSAPSSGKVPKDEHLARLLSIEVANCLGLPHVDMFLNNRPRGHKGSRQSNLRELSQNPFGYIGPEKGRLLVVDDVVYTRSTATRCYWAAQGAGRSIYFLILYRA